MGSFKKPAPSGCAPKIKLGDCAKTSPDEIKDDICKASNPGIANTKGGVADFDDKSIAVFNRVSAGGTTSSFWQLNNDDIQTVKRNVFVKNFAFITVKIYFNKITLTDNSVINFCVIKVRPLCYSLVYEL